jgi:hypothetical protein
MKNEERAILAYAQRALQTPELDNDVHFDKGGFQGQTHLRAHRRRGTQGDEPTALACADQQVKSLIRQGYLVQDGLWLTITPAGESALAGA